MKKIKTLFAVMLLMIGTVVVFPSLNARAASASTVFTKVAPDSDIRVEDMVKIELSMNGEVEIGAVESYISYNSDVFEYISGPDCVLGGEGVLRISDPGTSAYSTVRKYLLYFKAVAMGESEFSIRNNPEIYDANEGDAMSVSSQPLKLTVLAGTTASSDASLASLKVGSAVLSPSFDPLIKDYNVHVENSIEKLAVSAVANDPLAYVTVEGADSLKVGSNRITIDVSAPDGTENKYVIYCVRDEATSEEKEKEEAVEEKDTKAEENKETRDQSKEHEQAFYVTEQGGKITLIADTQYEIMEAVENVTVPDNFYRTSILVSGYTIPAFSPVPQGTPEYLLIILRKEGSDPGLYVYDRIEKTIQRYGLTDRYESQEKTEEKEKDEVDPEVEAAHKKTIGTLTTVIAVLSGVCMLLILLIIRIVLRRRGSGSREGSTGRRETKTSRKRRRT
ncbi:MAG: cadherin-like beta sandwich domain-containing protein [Lachnospiraceae bacterium]|nr:cadherin-like beta sandwich domain-containing protein [Lachnospiraceae bacterium]